MPKSDSQSPGLEPSAGTSAAPFWTAANKQPLQQHRFLVNFPIYEPLMSLDSIDTAHLFTEGNKNILGAAAAVAIANEFSSNSSDNTTVLQNSLAQCTSVSQIVDQVLIATSSAKYYPHYSQMSVNERESQVTKKLFSLAAYKNSFQKGRERISNNNRSNDIVKLSVTQFAALSFQPPSFGFVPGVADYKDGKGGPVIDPSKYQYSRGDATLTLITTLQENLHFSLNFLFNVAKSTKRLTKKQKQNKRAQLVSGGNMNAQNALLYPNAVVDLNMQERVLVIKELSAQGRPVGLHLLHDPAIKSVDFGEFNYGGTELLKVTLTLTYSANPDRGPLGYYSYQALARIPEPAPAPPKKKSDPVAPDGSQVISAAGAPAPDTQPEGSVSGQPGDLDLDALDAKVRRGPASEADVARIREAQRRR